MKVDIYTLSLVFDIYGAFWLARSLIIKSKSQIELESTSFWGGNYYLKASQLGAFYFGWYGFAFLAIGFLGQIVSQNIYLSFNLQILLIIMLILILFGIKFNQFTISKINKVIPSEVRDKHGSY